MKFIPDFSQEFTVKDDKVFLKVKDVVSGDSMQHTIEIANKSAIQVDKEINIFTHTSVELLKTKNSLHRAGF